MYTIHVGVGHRQRVVTNVHCQGQVVAIIERQHILPKADMLDLEHGGFARRSSRWP